MLEFWPLGEDEMQNKQSWHNSLYTKWMFVKQTHADMQQDYSPILACHETNVSYWPFSSGLELYLANVSWSTSFTS